MNPVARNRLIAIGAAVLIIVVIVLAIVFSGGKSSEEGQIKAEKPKKLLKAVKILTTTETGKALEIQALLAREGIPVRTEGKGSKIDIVLDPEDEVTYAQRDNAIITIVKSGIMDNNIGLEIFDKGDFTSSREDKRIRLARAINGELARLIKKIPGIIDASVFVAIPKDTIFTSMQQPTTATVQLVVDTGREKLEDNIIRTVKNLLIGSVEGLIADNISITDTNGNVYTSILSATDDMMKLLEENDNYMKQKIASQLDKLIGKGNYVVTVSTYLREVPLETDKLIYKPEESSIGSKQMFSENLGDSSHDKSKLSNAVSSYLPGGLPSPESSSNRNYLRAAEEYNYRVGQTRISEVKKPGTLEEISIAVTVSKGAIPSGMAVDELKQLIATAASPKARAKNVNIAFSDQLRPVLTPERPVERPMPEDSGNPWWTIAAVLAGLMIVGFMFISGRTKDSAKKHQKEIDSLMEIAQKQEQALQEANQRAIQLQNTQQQMYQQITSTAQQQQALAQQQPKPSVNVQETIRDIQKNIEEDVDEEQFAVTLKSWIESAG